jgi:hypothetical protein
MIGANPFVTQKEIAVQLNLSEVGVRYHIIERRIGNFGKASGKILGPVAKKDRYRFRNGLFCWGFWKQLS